MTRPISLRMALAAALALVAAACAPMQEAARKPEPPAPQVTEDTLRDRAKAELAQGVKQYETGDYDGALKSLTGSLDHGLLTKEEQARARKYLAFIHCLAGRESACRSEFRKAFEIYTAFALTPAEDGHPIWGPVYRDVRTQLIAEREALQGKPKESLGKAEKMLIDGLVKYEAGEFVEAYALLDGAYEAGLKEQADRVKALKHAAFCLCLQKKWRDCRNKFVSIYDVDPDFDLTPAESGHPEWRLTFASAKRIGQRKVAEERARAKEAAEKASASPPAATVPAKKN